mmetsp:Transcript_18536/g.25698  ORF Transcript_18536/g.25698 Transcript_18536/m.25698 type:complete len:252 (+) Transcript_18536:155-910(+)
MLITQKGVMSPSLPPLSPLLRCPQREMTCAMVFPTSSARKKMINQEKKRRKTVRFPPRDHEIVYYFEPDFSPEGLESKWFARNEIDNMKLAARAISKESQAYRGGALLDRVLSTASSISASMVTANSQLSLNLWSKHCHSRRGLECGVNHKHKMERRRQRSIVVGGVLRAQEDLSQRGGGFDSTKALSKVSSVLTKPARQYALLVGRADEYAVTTTFDSLSPLKTMSPDVRYLSSSVLASKAKKQEQALVA